MATQQPTAASDQFVELLRKSIAETGLSLREIGRRIGASTAYMSRLVNQKRGLPADKTIKKMAKVLNVDPGKLLDAAGRHDYYAAQAFARSPKTREFIRSLEPLTDEEFEIVMKNALATAKKYHPNEIR
jgi:transcriptional regulator with XRE-family HTH domain